MSGLPAPSPPWILPLPYALFLKHLSPTVVAASLPLPSLPHMLRRSRWLGGSNGGGWHPGQRHGGPDMVAACPGHHGYGARKRYAPRPLSPLLDPVKFIPHILLPRGSTTSGCGGLGATVASARVVGRLRALLDLLRHDIFSVVLAGPSPLFPAALGRCIEDEGARPRSTPDPANG